mmetsp:Transcript_65746/g.183109  ORF Transcript_65746/g.183109 Transcript_65746/m.183109 type:complete len:333 (-) Transcript_65746:28-1026(-)
MAAGGASTADAPSAVVLKSAESFSTSLCLPKALDDKLRRRAEGPSRRCLAKICRSRRAQLCEQAELVASSCARSAFNSFMRRAQLTAVRRQSAMASWSSGAAPLSRSDCLRRRWFSALNRSTCVWSCLRRCEARHARAAEPGRGSWNSTSPSPPAASSSPGATRSCKRCSRAVAASGRWRSASSLQAARSAVSVELCARAAAKRCLSDSTSATASFSARSHASRSSGQPRDSFTSLPKAHSMSSWADRLGSAVQRTSSSTARSGASRSSGQPWVSARRLPGTHATTSLASKLHSATRRNSSERGFREAAERKRAAAARLRMRSRLDGLQVSR